MKKSEYSVDLAICLDLTLDARKLFEQFKANCLRLFERIGKEFDRTGRIIKEFRVRIIGFKDFIEEDALFESQFFKIPEETEEFMQLVDFLEASGGGDIPENGLEALALALKSPWTEAEGLKRHVVCVITNAPALDFNERTNYPNYPLGMPKDIDELTEWYQNPIGTLSNRAKRVILIAPNDCYWSRIGSEWEYCTQIETTENINFEAYLDTIAEMVVMV